MDSKQGKRETNRRGEIMLKAVFSRFGEEIELTDELWQYDFGQKIQVTGIELPDVCEVHFQYDNLTETKTVTGYKQEDALIIDIPNEALTSRGIIKLYIYLVSSEEGRTVNVAIMHVNRRMKPEGFEVPEDIDLFHHTLLAANEYMQQTKSAKKSAETAANQAEDAKNAAESASGSEQTSADEAKTAKENAETAAKVAEAFKTEAETARSEAVRAATGSTDAKDSAEKSRAAAEKAKQDAEEAKAAADAETEAKKAQTATEAAKRETETAKNDAVQAKEAAERAKIGTTADRETAETASKVARISAMSAEESAKKAETAKEEIQESADQIQKNAIEIDSLKEDKITKPAEVPTIGKILRVKSVNEDGTFVCEWADGGGSNLDVRINGESIVQNGTAEIPLCTKTKEAGLISIDTYSSNGGLHRANGATGLIRIASATNNQIDERRNQFCPIVPETIDYAVKAAMCDGKGAAWTADEQTAARERMGAWTGDWQIIMDETLAELTQEVSFEVPDDTKEMICYFKSGAAPKNAQVYLRTSNNGSSIAESFTSFGGSLSNNTISIGCQKIQFLNSQYGLIEYSYLSHSTPSSADYVQRAGKPSLLRIDSKRFAFHSVDINGGYPVETRLLVLVRR